MEIMLGIMATYFLLDSALKMYFNNKEVIEQERTKQLILELCIKLGCTEQQLKDSLVVAFNYDEDDAAIQKLEE